MAFIGVVTEPKMELQIRQNLKREFEKLCRDYGVDLEDE